MIYVFRFDVFQTVLIELSKLLSLIGFSVTILYATVHSNHGYRISVTYIPEKYHRSSYHFKPFQ